MIREGSGFNFFQKFPRICMEKFKADIFDGPQIRELINDQVDEDLSKAELSLLAVTEFSIYKLPRKPFQYGIQEKHLRVTEEFSPIRGMNVIKTPLLW